MASRTYEVTQRRNPSVLRTRGKRVWTARVARRKDGEPRRPLNPNITQELIASIDRIVVVVELRHSATSCRTLPGNLMLFIPTDTKLGQLLK